MEMRKVVDSQGSWFLNKGQYPLVDPSNGCRFDPKVPTQVIQTAWMKGQPTIQLWEDAPKPVEPPKAAEPQKPAEPPKVATPAKPAASQKT